MIRKLFEQLQKVNEGSQEPQSLPQKIFKKLIDREIEQNKKELGGDSLGMDNYTFHDANSVATDATLYDVMAGQSEFGYGTKFKERLDTMLSKAGYYLEAEGGGVYNFVRESKKSKTVMNEEYGRGSQNFLTKKEANDAVRDARKAGRKARIEDIEDADPKIKTTYNVYIDESVKEAEEDQIAAARDNPNVIQQDKLKDEAEEEASEVTPGEEDEDVSPGGNKEYLGNNGTDMYFYLIKTPNSEGGAEDLQVTDSSGKILFSAEEHNLSSDNVKDFLVQALKEVDMSNIAFEIIMKYMIPAEEKSEEEIEDENMGKDEDASLRSPENSKDRQDGISAPPMPVGVGSRVGEAEIKNLMNKFGLNEDFADNWKVGDYIDQLGTIQKITPKVVIFLDDEGHRAVLGRVSLPPADAEGKIFGMIPKQSKGKLHKVDMNRMFATGDIDKATESKLMKKFGLSEDQYKSDDDIAAEFSGMNITKIEPGPSGISGWLEIEFPEGEEHVGGGTKTVVDHWIKYPHNGKIALENWYPEEIYMEIVRQIEAELSGLTIERLKEKFGLNEGDFDGLGASDEQKSEKIAVIFQSISNRLYQIGQDEGMFNGSLQYYGLNRSGAKRELDEIMSRISQMSKEVYVLQKKYESSYGYKSSPKTGESVKEMKKLTPEEEKEGEEIGALSRKHGFGTAAWQNALVELVKYKIDNNIPIGVVLNSFIQTQIEHTQRLEGDFYAKWQKYNLKKNESKDVIESLREKFGLNEYIKQLEIGQKATISTGNAQLVYGIKGKAGEEFKVTRDGTMVPVGKYKVLGVEADAAHSGPWGNFSYLVVQKISEAGEGVLSLEALKAKIAREVDYVDVKPYSHNIINLVLMQMAHEYGKEAANKTIDEFGLEELGWRKVTEATDIARKNMKCPQCRSKKKDVHKDGDTYCDDCGALIGATPKSAKESVNEEECPECDRPIQGGKCPNCGYSEPGMDPRESVEDDANAAAEKPTGQEPDSHADFAVRALRHAKAKGLLDKKPVDEGVPPGHERIGWFKTNQNPSGYNLFSMTDEERSEFPGATHRVTSFGREGTDSQWTSIVKIENGKVYFLDNDSYEAGTIKFQRPVKITMQTKESVNEEVLLRGIESEQKAKEKQLKKEYKNSEILPDDLNPGKFKLVKKAEAQMELFDESVNEDFSSVLSEIGSIIKTYNDKYKVADTSHPSAPDTSKFKATSGGWVRLKGDKIEVGTSFPKWSELKNELESKFDVRILTRSEGTNFDTFLIDVKDKMPESVKEAELPTNPIDTQIPVPGGEASDAEAPMGPDATGEEQAMPPSTPQEAQAQIKMDYPEEPFTSTALAFADLIFDEPKVFGAIRNLKWPGVYANGETFLKQVAIIDHYNKFTKEVAKRITEKFGDDAKYKLARDGSVAVFITILSASAEVSLSGLKDLTNADKVELTKSPGEIKIWWN